MTTDSPSNSQRLELPVLTLRSAVLYPGLVMPLSVGRPRTVAAVEAAAATEDKVLAAISQLDPEVDEPSYGNLHRFGTQAVIKRMQRTEDGLQLMVQGLERIETLELLSDDPFLKVAARIVERPTDWSTETEARQQAVLQVGSEILEIVNPQAAAGVLQTLSQIQDPLHRVYVIASMLTLDLAKEQALLAAGTCAEALELLHGYLTHEREVLKIRQKIQSEAQTEMSREQREYLLRQQLRAIERELGESNGEGAEIAELRRKVEEAGLPETVLKDADRELARLARLPPAAPDYQVTRNYIELLTELPWTKTTEDKLDLERARRILDEDHYDLRDIKDRIIEQLAVLKLNPNAKAPILCFVGPPGVGKTSLGQSIARAIGREFTRLSLGGMHDEAELRGHRRTYIGAMPGRILQAVRRSGVRNPLLMLDEIDKLGRDFRGDPAAALLEILDPAQNHEFRDNYLDQPFDLSRVFFITTANTLDSIPQPLLDRMETLRLSGYSDPEKRSIARQYLLPRRLAEAGLTAEQLKVSDAALDRIARGYTREAGVRELERMLGAVCRKVATRFATGDTTPVTVEPEDLEALLGPERFFEEEARRNPAPGVAAGLAWTQSGGEILYIEALRLPEGEGLHLTGQLGDVMKESARAARSYVGSHAAELGIATKKLRGGLHIHVPAGATPKDGPSAGVAIAVALASLYSGEPVRGDTAMTGEITLSGLVLPVGGIKEKVLAAHRAGMRRVLLPRRNQKDLRDLPEHVRESLEIVFLATIGDALASAIPALQARAKTMQEREVEVRQS